MNTFTTFTQFVGQTSDFPMGLEVENAEGIYVYDVNGRKYKDLISGIGVNVLGHKHPAIVDAIKKQAEKYLHVMVYGEFIQKPQNELARLLVKHLPASLEQVFFTNSGSEAVEGALKLAKRYTNRSQIVSFKKAYHGSTAGALSICGDEDQKRSFRPLLPDVLILDFDHPEQLQLISPKTACVIIEPIQGEGGINIPSQGYLQKLKSRCREQGCLLIFDEIQTGMGRTGKLFAFEHENIVPDILLTGKAFGGGLPLSAFISSAEIMSCLKTDPVLGHITTFGGNPLCCAAGKACLETLLSSGLIELAEEKGEIFRKLLKHPKIVNIRGKGLMLAMELQNDQAAKRFIWLGLEKGIISDWFLFDINSIRIAPPLIISKQEIEDACQVILEILDIL